MQQIIDEIHAYIVQGGGLRSDWYVGIAGEPRDCLFSRHGVQEQGGLWIHRDASNDATARTIEKAFLDWGTKGGGGGGDDSTRHVYAYRITAYTRE